MTQNTRPHLVELRLKALTAQVSVASQAHIAIHQSANSPVGDEVRDLFTKIETLSRFALASSKFNFSGTIGDYREEIDIVLQQADRLLQWDRESASRVLRLHTVHTSGVSGTFNNVETIEIHGHLAALESFVSAVKSVAYAALLSSTPTEHLSASRVERTQLRPEMLRA